MLDHCFASSLDLVNYNCSLVNNEINFSDHKPLKIIMVWLSMYSGKQAYSVDLDSYKNIITIPPNFDNDEIKEKFNSILINNINYFMDQPIDDINNNQNIIDNMYSQLTTSMVSAFKSCCRTVSVNNMKKQKNWFTSELQVLKNKMLILRYKTRKTEIDIIELKSLKYNFKKIMKSNINLYEKNQYFKINHLIKINNSEKFFKKVNDMKRKSELVIDIDIDKMRDYYSNIFNKVLKVDVNFVDHVNREIDDIKHENFTSIEINYNELELALKETSNSNVIGNDGVSSNMILNCDVNFLKSKLFYFFKYIFKFGVIPKGMNITHIRPIIKDKSLPSNDLNNLRPISISNVLAQLFERILGYNLNEIRLTHQNQFGYKSKTSCTHALFIFKETIIRHIEMNKSIIAVKLDAVKAFDLQWREALFYKLKVETMKLNKNLNKVILLRIYYDTLESKIRNNNEFSKLFKLLRGVKQGGVLSGNLFNFFINDLIEMCCNANIGARFLAIIVCILVFCDDICLLSESIEDMQLLLKLCEEFAIKWGIEFNLEKCKYIIFGKMKSNNIILKLNNQLISFTDCFKYLGLEFNSKLDMSSYFIKKFQMVKNSFFSLNSFGFKQGGVNPFLQIFVYKSFCISRILYGLEIMNLNKKTLKLINIGQNDIVRYITGLSRHSHITNTLKILKLFSINDLYYYMKLIFVKNLKSNFICNYIFNILLDSNYKNNSLSFIKEFKLLCGRLKETMYFVVDNINLMLVKYKDDFREYERNDENELILTCLQNSSDYIMRQQLNFITYAGPT